MASTILGIAHFTFHDGTFDDFRRLSERCRQIVATQDTGTLRHDIYVTEDQTRAVVVEEYEDEDALRAHGEHIGEELPSAVLAGDDVRHVGTTGRSRAEPARPLPTRWWPDCRNDRRAFITGHSHLLRVVAPFAHAR